MQAVLVTAQTDIMQTQQVACVKNAIENVQNARPHQPTACHASLHTTYSMAHVFSSALIRLITLLTQYANHVNLLASIVLPNLSAPLASLDICLIQLVTRSVLMDTLVTTPPISVRNVRIPFAFVVELQASVKAVLVIVPSTMVSALFNVRHVCIHLVGTSLVIIWYV